MSETQSPSGATGQDDDSILERIDDVIDTALGEDLPPPAEVDPWERRERLLDSWTAVLLGIGAFLTAWASYQSTLWSDVQSDALESAATARSTATRLEAEASRVELVDTSVWLAWLSAYGNNRERVADFLRDRFSPQLDAAQRAWLKDSPFDPEGDPLNVPPGTPFADEAYVVVEREQQQEQLAQADAIREGGTEASEASSTYVLLVVLFALSLFFIGIATKLGRPKIQVALIVLGMMLMSISAVRMMFLPHLF